MDTFLTQFINTLEEVKEYIKAGYDLPGYGDFVIIEIVNKLRDDIPTIHLKMAYILDSHLLSEQWWLMQNVFDVSVYWFEDDARIMVNGTCYAEN